MGKWNGLNKGKQPNSNESKEPKSMSWDLFGALKISEVEKSALNEMPVEELRNFCIDRLKDKFWKTHNVVSNDVKGGVKIDGKLVEKICYRIDITPKNWDKKSVPEVIFSFNDDKTVNVGIKPYNDDTVSYNTDAKKPLPVNEAFTEVYKFCASWSTYLKKNNLVKNHESEIMSDIESFDPNDWIKEENLSGPKWKFDQKEHEKIDIADNKKGKEAYNYAKNHTTKAKIKWQQ